MACLTGISGCGGAASPSLSRRPAATASATWSARPRHGQGMQVEGILGTIPQRRIEEVLEAKLPEFQRCFFKGSREIGALAGHIKFYFHVGLDGRVQWVHPRGSSIGHRETELCLLTRAAAARFPAPKGGGPAEFVWGFELEPAQDSSEPRELSADQVADSVEAQRDGLSACGVEVAGHYVVTAYIAPGGAIQAVGAAADSNEAAQHIDCIVDTIRGWAFSDPGATSAKVSFRL